jgi:hypothetical protein
LQCRQLAGAQSEACGAGQDGIIAPAHLAASVRRGQQSLQLGFGEILWWRRTVRPRDRRQGEGQRLR